MSKKNVCKKMLTAAMCVAMLVPSVCTESGGITVNSSELAQEKVWTQLAGSIQITASASELLQEPVEETDNNSQTEQAQTTTEVSGDGMQQNETEVAAAETATEKKVINGWRRNKKKTYYYVDGKRVKGWQRN